MNRYLEKQNMDIGGFHIQLYFDPRRFDRYYFDNDLTTIVKFNGFHTKHDSEKTRIYTYHAMYFDSRRFP